jgi:hypothetical protein
MGALGADASMDVTSDVVEKLNTEYNETKKNTKPSAQK